MAAGLPTVARRRAGKRARLVRDWPSLESLSHLPREQVLGKLLYAAKQPLFAMPFYGVSLSAPAPTRLAATPNDPWPGKVPKNPSKPRWRGQLCCGESGLVSGVTCHFPLMAVK